MSSSPTRVCMCEDSVANCSISEYEVSIVPGQTITLDVVAVGQRYGTVISFITATTDEAERAASNTRIIPETEYFQNVQRTCTTVHYTIMSSRKEVRLHLVPFQSNKFTIDRELLKQHPNQIQLFERLSIKVNLKLCPLGFVFSQTTRMCTCQTSLIKHGLTCNTKSFKITRTQQKWVGVVYNHTAPDEYPGVVVHDQCPHDYCRKDDTSLSIQLEFQDDQCAKNRSGMLCGKCQPLLSQVLGSSRCKKCSSLMLLAIIPLVIVCGLLLVIFLMILNLTVSVGTINGLIFYANVIRARHTMFFVPEISNSFLSRFIAWLNLDLGVEVCLYDGLDSYTKTWLQFLFPIYIWLMVILIIVSSHYSSKVSRLSGNNAVQVLATLFLLSYTKILRIIITVFTSTVIEYPNNAFTQWVWLYDGNIDFLRGKHLALFVFTLLMFFLLSVPYTFSLVTIQWLLKVSHYRLLFWVQKLKPLFDAYTGPYKTRYRYWTGLLLVVRVVVLIAFSLNRTNNPAVDSLIIAVVSLALVLFLYSTRWVYKSVLNNYLEIASVLNLGLLSTFILYDMANDKRSALVVQLSTGFALVLFILICAYHILQQILKSGLYKKLKERFQNMYQCYRLTKRRSNTIVEADRDVTTPNQLSGGITHTVVELQECLLADNKDQN